MFLYQLKVNANKDKQAAPTFFYFLGQETPLDPVGFEAILLTNIKMTCESDKKDINQKIDKYLNDLANAEALLNRRDLVAIIQNLCKKRAENINWKEIVGQ